jgi:nucleotide-binding universal stress UspA family protein
MFTRLLIGLDGSTTADEALEQAVVLAHRFRAKLVIAHVREAATGRRAPHGAKLLERAGERARAAQVDAETALRQGDADRELAALAHDVDAVLVGRRGSSSPEGVLGTTVASLIRIAERCVIVCGATPSPMEACAIAFDGRETAMRALALVGRFASIAHSTVHIIHATVDPSLGTMVVGEAEAALSLQGVPFVTHIERATPGEAVARVVERTKCDALFAGAHVARRSAVTVSHAEEILRHTDIPVVIQP